MIATIVVFSTISLFSATQIVDEDYKILAIRREIIDFVNSQQSTWKAGVNVRFANATIADVKKMLGTILPGEKGYQGPELTRSEFKYDAASIPQNFDARTSFPACSAVTSRVRDQSSCGSCWAFGSTEAFNDRYCISTGDASLIMSPEDTVSCCSGPACFFSQGCNGGYPAGAWNWLVKTGVSTGGDYADIGTGTTCKPYSLPSCAHHVEPPPGMVACDTLPEYKTPKCSSACTEKTYNVAYSNDKHHAASSYSVKGVSDIQSEIMERGTVTVSMTVYEDFEAYTSGVYQHLTGKSLGGHSIKMLGWGVDESTGTPYWLCMNSWNDSWGENGLFRILRGTDECGIESDVVAGEV